MTSVTSQRIRQAIDRCGDASEVSDDDIAGLEAELDVLLSQIAETASAIDAASKLLELGDMQELLSVLAFKYDVKLTDRQRRVVREYDRWDDEETRAYFFKEIAAGRV